MRTTPLPGLVLAATATLSAGLTGGARAVAEPSRTGFYETGMYLRKDAAGPETIVVHEIKARPAQRTTAALVQADVARRFRITPVRDTPCASFRTRLVAGLVRNGLPQATAAALAAACSGTTLKARTRVVLAYSPVDPDHDVDRGEDGLDARDRARRDEERVGRVARKRRERRRAGRALREDVRSRVAGNGPASRWAA